MTEAKLREGNAAIGLFHGRAAWRVTDLERDRAWIRPFSDAEIDELEGALSEVRRRGLAVPDIAREDFPLPGLAAALEGVAKELEGGRGFQLMRGLPVQRYTLEETEIIYWGLSAHLGTAVIQNYKDQLVGHIQDLVPDPNDPPSRGYLTNKPLSLHNDSTDVVGLHCFRTAKSGGQSILVSSMTLHNEILARRPDLLEVLYEPFYFDRKGEDRPGRKPYYSMAVFHRAEGYLTARYNRAFIETGHKHGDVPRLTKRQIEALDFLDAVAEQDELRLVFEFQAGDIYWINSYVTLHGRTEFEDDPEDREQKRHLLRLWLTLHQGRPLPAAFQGMYGTTAPGEPRTGFNGR